MGQREKIEKLAKRKRPTSSHVEGVGFSPHAHAHVQKDVGEGAWRVVRNPELARGSGVDKQNRLARVPLGGSRHEELVRLHEAEHLAATDLPRLKKWLSKNRVPLQESQLRQLEEIRVNGRLTGKGYATPQEWQALAEADGEFIPPWSAIAAKANTAMDATEVEKVAEAALSRCRLGDFDYSKSSPTWLREIVCRAQCLWRAPDSPRAIKHLAKAVKFAAKAKEDEMAGKAVSDAIAQTLGARQSREWQKLLQKAGGDPQKATQQLQAQLQAAGKREGPPRWHGNKPKYVEGADGWGQVNLIRLPLTVRVSKRGEGRRWLVTDEPTSKTFRPERFMKWGDRMGFKRRKRHKGTGSFLLDGSASMDWSTKTILEVVKAMPKANIAMYSGGGSEGHLVIVAEKGMRASDAALEEAIELYMGNRNTIDGPALEWLAEQPEPRIWVSDGCVNGRVFRGTPANLLVEVAGICMRARISRVEDHEIAETLGVPFES